MRDLYNNLKVIRAIEPKAVGTSGIANGSLSPVIDRLGFDSVLFDIAYGTAGATGDTITPVVYECETSGGTYTSVADTDLLGTEANAALPAEATARTSGVGKNVAKKLGYIGEKRFLKIRLYGTGTATGIVSCNAIMGTAHRKPVA